MSVGLITFLLLAVIATGGAQEGPLPVPYGTPSTCTSEEFYQSGNLSCLRCPDNQLPSLDGTSCECTPGNYQLIGTQHCQPCGASQVASDNRLFCLHCTPPLSYNPSTASCEPCDLTEIYVDSLPSSQEAVGNRSCVPCPDGTWADSSRMHCVQCGVADCDQCEGSLSGGVCFSTDTRLPPPPADAFPYYQEHFSAAVILCERGNQTACQLLANLCVLRGHAPSDPACQQARSLFYPLGTAREVLERTDIMTKFVAGGEGVSSLPLVIVAFDLSGVLLGVEQLTNQILLCQDLPSRAEAAWSVGVLYQIECSVELPVSSSDPVFYDLYLRDVAAGADQLYPIPLLPTEYRDSDGQLVNQASNPDSWQLVQRLFLSEAVTSAPSYARSMELRLNLHSDGFIFTPYLRISYDQWISGSTGSHAVSFQVQPQHSTSGFDIGLAVTVAGLAVLAVVWVGFRVNGFLRRTGSLCCELPTFVFVLAQLCAHLSTAIFAVLTAAAVFWLIFFKAQTTFFLALPTGSQQLSFSILLGLALLFRAIYTIYLIWYQCSIDIFLIDWERPRGLILTTNQIADGIAAAPPTPTTAPVSIWRTYFVANEWNEIQSHRKINPFLLLVTSLLFLEVVGLNHLAEMDPSSHISVSGARYSAPHSSILRFALTSLTFTIAAVVMRSFVFLVYERFFEHKIRQFIDLCSVSNVSVFITSHKLFGYYIHGRSVHGHADTNMKEMRHNLLKEQDDMCGQRGLLADSDLQTFEVALTRQFREHYDRITAPLQAARSEVQGHSASTTPGGQSRALGGLSEAGLVAYEDMNQFLCAFIERTLQGMEWVEKNKTLAERALGMEFYDAVDRGLFYSDSGTSFDSLLFYGNEWSLLLLDVLVFAAVDLASHSFVLAAIITFIVQWVIALVHGALCRRNLGRKTLVDERFLI